MKTVNFDLDALRTFSTGIELGSFAQAAKRLNRSTSAVSAQLKKLEQQAGVAIMRKSGRGLLLTDAGELLLSYARRMLALNDEARMALGSAGLAGTVRLGMQEDFGEHLLSDILGSFARAHPAVHIEARIARNAELVSRVQAGDLDLALAWQDGAGAAPHADAAGAYPLHWIGPADWPPADARDPAQPVPIVAMDAPCLFRKTATDALDRAGIAWRLALTSPSLGGVWAAVAAGLGLTVRTEFGVTPGARIMPGSEHGLPPLGSVELLLHRAARSLDPAAERLRTIILENIRRRQAEQAGPADKVGSHHFMQKSAILDVPPPMD